MNKLTIFIFYEGLYEEQADTHHRMSLSAVSEDWHLAP